MRINFAGGNCRLDGFQAGPEQLRLNRTFKMNIHVVPHAFHPQNIINHYFYLAIICIQEKIAG